MNPTPVQGDESARPARGDSSAPSGSGHRIAMLALVLLAIWALKRDYADADVGALRWILKPVASLAAILGGTSFEWEAGSGYLSRAKLLMIAKPCAGVNFMLAAFGMTGFLLSEHATSWRRVVQLTLFGAAVSYAATIVANTARIVVALWLSTHPIPSTFMTPSRLHRLEGVVVYFAMLAALHVIIRWLMTTTRGRALAAWVPLASYYAVTIAIPLANGSGEASPAFIEHVAVVAVVPLTLVGVISWAERAVRRARTLSRAGAMH